MTNDDDHITLKDAEVKFGHKVSTLWAENARGNLEIWKIGNKWHTSPAAITGNDRHFCARPVPRLLRVAETQLARLAADGDEASAKILWPYVKRDMSR